MNAENAEKPQKRRKGAVMIIDRCKQLARELGVDLEGVEWKENIEDAKKAYTLVVRVGSECNEVQLADTELQAYPSKTNTEGTDAKLKSIIKKRY
jgi:hypothetical protein